MSWISERLPSIFSISKNITWTGYDKDREDRKLLAIREAMENRETNCFSEGILNGNSIRR